MVRVANLAEYEATLTGATRDEAGAILEVCQMCRAPIGVRTPVRVRSDAGNGGIGPALGGVGTVISVSGDSRPSARAPIPSTRFDVSIPDVELTIQFNVPRGYVGAVNLPRSAVVPATR